MFLLFALGMKLAKVDHSFAEMPMGPMQHTPVVPMIDSSHPSWKTPAQELFYPTSSLKQ